MSIVITSQNAGMGDDETAVRTLTQLTDIELVTSAAVLKALDLAEGEINSLLKPEYLNSVDNSLLEGKYMLSASFLLRSLATALSFSQKAQKIGNSSESATRQASDLLTLAKEWENLAWGRLARFCQEKPGEINNETMLVKNESW